MSNETLKAIVNLFVVSTPGQSNAARRTQFAELLEQMAPTLDAQPVTPQPSVTQAPPVGVATWPYGSAKPVQPGPSAKPNLAQALGLKTPAPAALVSTVSENGRLYVNIRKHPQGHPQPIGKRKVVRLEVRGDVISVGIGDGRLGWTFNLKDPAPSFLDFIVNGEKGQKVSLPEAIAYWKRHNS